jgi:DNA-binding response OmpR family regulator
MALNPESRARFNLSKASILLLDPTPMGMAIMAQIVSGLGARQLHRCDSVAQAKETVANFELHLMIIDSISQTGDGYDFVHWLRREAKEPNLYAPVILTASHTRLADVTRSRTCGSHFIVAKPIAPIVMLERIIWVSKEGRGFVTCDDYIGPDRRVQDTGPPPYRVGLRREDKLRLQDEAPTAEDPPGEKQG